MPGATTQTSASCTCENMWDFVSKFYITSEFKELKIAENYVVLFQGYLAKDQILLLN